MELSFHALMNTSRRKVRTAIVMTVPTLFKVFYKNDWESYRLLKIFYEAMCDVMIIKTLGLIIDVRGRISGLRPFSFMTRNVRNLDGDWQKPFFIAEDR